jgi:hypothetical protein
LEAPHFNAGRMSPGRYVENEISSVFARFKKENSIEGK